MPPYHRGKAIAPGTGKSISPPTHEAENIPSKLWELLGVTADVSPEAAAAGLLDPSQHPVLMMETTPAEMLQALDWGTGGNKIRRLLRSLELLASTQIHFQANTPEYRYSFHSNLLSYFYAAPKRKTGNPTLKIALNHFSVHAIGSKEGGYILHQVGEKIGLGQLQLAIHSQLCRLVKPGATQPVKVDTISKWVYPDSMDRNRMFRFRKSFEDLGVHLLEFGWVIRKRGEDYYDVRRPAPPKAADFILSPTEIASSED